MEEVSKALPQDIIRIDGLRIDCIIGIRPEERVREQSLELDVEMSLDSRKAGLSGQISETCDYARVADELTTYSRFRRCFLLEMLAEEQMAMLFGNHPELEEIRLTIRKPRALEGRARSAGVSISRKRSDYPSTFEESEFGEVEVLFETKHAGLYLLHVGPGKTIPPHFHRVMRELEWLASGQLYRGDRVLKDFDPIVWSHGEIHSYENRGDRRATLFCCDMPPFLPEDEVLSSSETSGKNEATPS